ncbi:hypothetical protein Bca101_075889 [Brassica carinata]
MKQGTKSKNTVKQGNKKIQILVKEKGHKKNPEIVTKKEDPRKYSEIRNQISSKVVCSQPLNIS